MAQLVSDIEWKGYDKLKAKFAKLPKIAHDAIWDGSFDVVEKTQGYIVENLKTP